MSDTILKLMESIEIISQHTETISQHVSIPDGENVLVEMKSALSKLRAQAIAHHKYQIKISKVCRKLEKKLSKYTDWEKTQARYEPYEWASGVILYRIKEEFRGKETVQDFCPHCIANRKESAMGKKEPNSSTYTCTKCGWEVRRGGTHIKPMLI